MLRLPDPAPGSKRRWFIFVLGSLNFVISMFYRVSVAVISPALTTELGLTGAQLGDLSAAFFYGFAACQIPIGVSMDRLGPRLTMCFLAISAIGGAIVFSIGQNAETLIVGRALLGIGMGGNLMVLLALLAVWFPADRFAFLGGSVVSVGVLGNLLAATPLAMLSMSIGWRNCFLVFAIINAVIVTSFVIVIRDFPPGYKAPERFHKSLMSGLGFLLKKYSYWSISLSNFVRYGYFASLQGLWAGPFLIYGLGLGEITASNAILVMGIGYMIGLPVSGSISDKVLRSRKQVVLTTMVGFAVLAASALLWTRDTSVWIVFATFFGFGLTAAPGQILYAHIKELLPAELTAQAMTAVNLFTILGAAIITQFLGFIIGAEPATLNSPQDFNAVWIVGVVLLAAVSVLYMFVPDSKALKSE